MVRPVGVGGLPRNISYLEPLNAKKSTIQNMDMA